MNIQDLLNSPSSSSSRSDEDQSQSPASSYSQPATSPITSHSPTPSPSPATPPPRKIKLIKDAPVFTPGAKPRGAINFPPYEAEEGSELAAQHEMFQIHPRGHIADFPRHIPYRCDKKGFLEKTGREGFDVYQYTFRMPGEHEDRTVMWDYNNGLVRITPFFKCLRYSKVQPAKVLNINPGLRDLSHSITGGALAAQGYWMPYNCARAVASTFCYKIRYALTPIFGPTFPSTCTHPSNPAYDIMIIDQAIIREATEEARAVREASSTRFLTPASTPAPSSAMTLPANTPSRAKKTRTRAIRSATPSTPSKRLAPKPSPLPFGNPHLNREQWTLASAFHPKTKTIRQPRDSVSSDCEVDFESGRGDADTDDSDVPISPKTRPEDLRRMKLGGTGWTTVNGAQREWEGDDGTPSPWLSSVPTSPSPAPYTSSPRKRPLCESSTAGEKSIVSAALATVGSSPSGHEESASESADERPGKKHCVVTSSREARAAMMLLKLRDGDAGFSWSEMGQVDGDKGEGSGQGTAMDDREMDGEGKQRVGC